MQETHRPIVGSGFYAQRVTFSRREYETYIASPAWTAKRERALKKHGAKCKACGSTDPGLHVHHHTYDRFKRERMDDLVILCKSCHQLVHRAHNTQRFAKGPNLTLTEVTFAFIKQANPKVYSRAVMADHTPAAGLASKRRAAVMDEAARTRIAASKAKPESADAPSQRTLQKRAAQDKAWRKLKRQRRG